MVGDLATTVDVGDHDVGDDYLQDSVMFTRSVMLQPRSMASQTMKAAESPNTTYKVPDDFFLDKLSTKTTNFKSSLIRFGDSRMYRGKCLRIRMNES